MPGNESLFAYADGAREVHFWRTPDGGLEVTWSSPESHDLIYVPPTAATQMADALRPPPRTLDEVRAFLNAS